MLSATKMYFDESRDLEIFIFRPDLVILSVGGKETSYHTYYDPSEDEYLPPTILDLNTDRLECLLEMFSSCADEEMLELYLEELSK